MVEALGLLAQVCSVSKLPMFTKLNTTYQPGGSLPPDAPTYVVRQADTELYEGSAQFNRHLQKSRDVPWNVSTTRVLCQASLNSAYVY